MPRGGYRPSNPGGRPKGRKNNSTLTKEASREEVRQAVLKHLDELLAAQLEHAKGLKYLVRRDKGSGKFVRVTANMLALAGDEDVIEMWEKEPNVPAFTDLMNRALDKPAEQKQEHDVSGTLVIKWAE